MRRRLAALAIALALVAPPAGAEPAAALAARLKDIARIGGVRDNQLLGYGIVVGLDASGDKNVMTAVSISNALRHFGINVDPKQLKAQNSAAVMVTAKIGAFGRPGDAIDIVVSSIGDAKSIKGGVLLQTPLQGADGTVYAVAQGPISIGGFELGQQAGAAGAGNHPTVARVPNGALVEREIPFAFAENGAIDVVLNRKDFSTANAVALAVGARFGENFTRAVDAGLVRVTIPASFRDDPVRFVAAIESVPVEVDGATRIVINEKTGTIVIGSEVRVEPVVIAHGDLRLRIQDNLGQSQRTDKAVVQLQAGVSVKELVDQLNALGVTAKDIIAIIQAIKASGAIQAELEII